MLLFLLPSDDFKLILKNCIVPLYRTNPEELVAEIRQSEPLITESRADQVKQLIIRLQQKQGQQDHHRFCFFKVRHWALMAKNKLINIVKYLKELLLIRQCAHI